MICKIALGKQCNDANNSWKQTRELTAERRVSGFKDPSGSCSVTESDLTGRGVYFCCHLQTEILNDIFSVLLRCHRVSKEEQAYVQATREKLPWVAKMTQTSFYPWWDRGSFSLLWNGLVKCKLITYAWGVPTVLRETGPWGLATELATGLAIAHIKGVGKRHVFSQAVWNG